MEQTDEVFQRMAARYGHAWASQYADDGSETGAQAFALAVSEWAEALAGVTEAQIRTGFRADARRGEHWPPSAPEFAVMCHGIPSLARVKHILARVGPSRTRFTRLVWSLLDTFQFTRADAKYADRLLADAYELAKTHVMSGHPLPDEPSGALEHQPEPRTPARPETVARAVREVTEKLRPKEPDVDTTNAASEEPAP